MSYAILRVFELMYRGVGASIALKDADHLVKVLLSSTELGGQGQLTLIVGSGADVEMGHSTLSFRYFTTR